MGRFGTRCLLQAQASTPSSARTISRLCNGTATLAHSHIYVFPRRRSRSFGCASVSLMENMLRGPWLVMGCKGTHRIDRATSLDQHRSWEPIFVTQVLTKHSCVYRVEPSARRQHGPRCTVAEEPSWGHLNSGTESATIPLRFLMC